MSRPVVLRVDEVDLAAVEGEPVAIALYRAGRRLLGRSIKYHRPRGATCFRGRCEGCAMRVDGQPSVRTCQVPARHGLVVSTQNVVGSAHVDLLGVTDAVFSEGLDHHGMFTWGKLANRAMQWVAREVAGVGELPSEASPIVPARELSCDVLVVGAGPSGLDAAARCARRGLRVVLVDEAEAIGGERRFEPNAPPRSAPEGVIVLLAHACLALFEDEGSGSRQALLGSGRDVVRVSMRALVLATGRVEGGLAFPGSDLPGLVLSEGAQRLLAHGVHLGKVVAVVVETGAPEGRAQRLVAALTKTGSRVLGPFALGQVECAHAGGLLAQETGAVAGLTVGGTKLDCDAVVTVARTSAAHELAMQLGAEVELRDDAFELVMTGRVAGDAFVTGSMCGARRPNEADLDAWLDGVMGLAKEHAK